MGSFYFCQYESMDEGEGGGDELVGNWRGKREGNRSDVKKNIIIGWFLSLC